MISYKKFEKELEEECKLISLLSRYSTKGGVFFNKYLSEHERSPSIHDEKNNTETFFESYDEKGRYEPRVKAGIDLERFEETFDKHFEEEKKIDNTLQKEIFLDLQIHYLENLSDQLKADYRGISNSLKKRFEVSLKRVEEEKNQSSTVFTNRVKALVYTYKIETKEEQPMKRKDMKPKNFEMAVDSFNPLSKKYKEPTEIEIQNAIKLLSNFPKSKTLAEKSLKMTMNKKS